MNEQNKRVLRCAFTGYRPQKMLPYKFDESHPLCIDFKERL